MCEEHTLCGLDCCGECQLLPTCGGCQKTDGHPFGGRCTAAECIRNGGKAAMDQLKQQLVAEINGLGIAGLQIQDLNLLLGSYVNLSYPLPSGSAVPFLKNENVYWGAQLERPGGERCFGVLADESFLLICEYGAEGSDPKLLRYQARG